LDNAANYAAGGPLFNLYPTLANQTAQLGDDDASDSDAVNVVNPAGSPAGTFPVISIMTGGPGANNHTLDAGFSLSPTAAGVLVEGRIVTSDGRGIRNVLVTLTERNGTQHSAITGPFGYFAFEDIEVGQTVIVSVSAKRFTFSNPVLVVHLTDNVSNVDFVANE
jgi:hypothetical protein